LADKQDYRNGGKFVKINVYVEGSSSPNLTKVRLSQKENIMALLRRPNPTADTVPVCDGNIVLPWRKKLPMGNRWWRIGGAIDRGDAPQEAAARNFNRETGLSRKVEDFVFLNNLGSWSMEVTEKIEKEEEWAGEVKGGYVIEGDRITYWRHDLCFLHAIVLSRKEVDSFRLDVEEYEQKVRLASPTEVIKMAADGELHESFFDAFLAIQKARLL